MALGDLDTRWKNPQGATPDQLYLWAQDLIKELRKGDYLSAGNATGSVTNAQLANMAAWTIKMRNNASAGVPQDQTINDLTELTSIDTANDFFPMWDASGTAMFKAKPSNFTTAPPAQGITTIASGSFPAAATQDVTNIPATYAYLVIYFTGASSNTATRLPLVQVSTNNGSSFDATATNYRGSNTLATLVEGVASPAVSTFKGVINLFGYQGGPFAFARSYVEDNNTASPTLGNVAYIGSVSAINAIRFLWNGSGNFDAGTYAVYGVR